MDGARFHDFITHCTPLRFAEPWDTLPAGPDAFRGRADPAAALSALLERCGQEELLATGLAVRDSQGGATIHPRLAAPSIPIFAIQSRRGAVNNLLTPSGAISIPSVPLLACLHGTSIRPRELVLTGALEDTLERI